MNWKLFWHHRIPRHYGGGTNEMIGNYCSQKKWIYDYKLLLYIIVLKRSHTTVSADKGLESSLGGGGGVITGRYETQTFVFIHILKRVFIHFWGLLLCLLALNWIQWVKDGFSLPFSILLLSRSLFIMCFSSLRTSSDVHNTSRERRNSDRECTSKEELQKVKQN